MTSSDRAHLLEDGGQNPQINYDSNKQVFDGNPGEYKEKCRYFRDGITSIDYVLVVSEPRISEANEEQLIKKENARKKYFENLKNLGVVMETEIEEGGKMILTYTKIHVPWKLMCRYADELNLRVPLQDREAVVENSTEKILQKLHIPNICKIDIPNRPPVRSTCSFKASKLEKYLGHEDKKTFFTMAQRHQVAYEILQTQLYGKRKRAEIGIDRLIKEDVFDAAYPLHEGIADIPEPLKDEPNKWNRRQVLRHYWASYKKMFKYQPLNMIREYFGEMYAIYFAWLGIYTMWLLPAAVVGLLAFIYGIVKFGDMEISKQICSAYNVTICPACDDDFCKPTNLTTGCLNSKIIYLFDHPGTIFMSIFIAFWGIAFLEHWKRKNAEVAHQWDVMDFEEEDERPRPDYAALCPELKQNEITGIIEPHFPDNIQRRRVITGMITCLIMILVVIIFMIGVIVYRTLVQIPMYQVPFLRPYAKIGASITAAVINLILIMLLGIVYEKLAVKLTDWEMHRTETEYEDSLILKVFIFQFCNFYSSIFYIAFFKGRFNGYPGNYGSFLGVRNENCSNNNCVYELAQQMAVIMVGKQILSNFKEIFIPKLKTFLHRKKEGLTKTIQLTGDENACVPWSDDYKLIEHPGLFSEYLEMVIQFGFICLFVAAFPIAPIFALINNWMEIRLDAKKLVEECRRPVAKRREDIGLWQSILEIIVRLGIITNGLLLGFTTEFIPRMMYKYKINSDLIGYTDFSLANAPANTTSVPCKYHSYRDDNGHYTAYYWQLLAVRLAFVLLFEHLVFAIVWILSALIPDIPKKLEILIRREDFLGRQALNEVDMQLVDHEILHEEDA